MANDSLMVNQQPDNFYRISGTYTSTVVTSRKTIGYNPLGCEWDGVDFLVLRQFANPSKFFSMSGIFTTTVHDSYDIESKETDPEGTGSDENLDFMWAGVIAQKSFLGSGKFTTTVKTSLNITSRSPGNITWDGSNCPMTDLGGVRKLILVSGKFSTTIKDSYNVSGDGTEPQPRSTNFDGENSPYGGTWSTFGRAYLDSGQFTGTMKDSVQINTENSWVGVTTVDYEARLGITSSFVSALEII